MDRQSTPFVGAFEVTDLEPGVFVIIIPATSVPAGTFLSACAVPSLNASIPKVVIGTKGAQIKAIMEKSGMGPR